MPRLVTFGCSYTYGSGLPDTFNSDHILYPGSHPSEFAWPQVLANKLGLECLNLSKVGAGNKEILLKSIFLDLKENDLVLIMWSHFPRYDFFRAALNGSGTKENRNDIHLRSWVKNTDIISKEWKEDNAIQNYLAIKFVQMFLDNKNIKHYSLFTINDFFDYEIPFFIDQQKIIKIHQRDFIIDHALDKRHFGVKSHDNLANILYNKLNELR